MDWTECTRTGRMLPLALQIMNASSVYTQFQSKADWNCHIADVHQVGGDDDCLDYCNAETRKSIISSAFHRRRSVSNYTTSIFRQRLRHYVRMFRPLHYYR